MSVRDEIAPLLSTRGTQCRVAVFLATMSTKERAEVDELIGDPGITSAAFSRWSEKRGSRVSDQSWSRHRRGECACGRG